MGRKMKPERVAFFDPPHRIKVMLKTIAQRTNISMMHACSVIEQYSKSMTKQPSLEEIERQIFTDWVTAYETLSHRPYCGDQFGWVNCLSCSLKDLYTQLKFDNIPRRPGAMASDHQFAWEARHPNQPKPLPTSQRNPPSAGD